MHEELAEPVAELAGIVVYGAVATALTVLGALAEWAGVHNLQAGQATAGAWEVAVGLVVLYAAVNVATDFVLPRLRAVRGP